MTLESFAESTINVIRDDGMAEYLPTLAFPEAREFRVIKGIPETVDHRAAVQKVVRRSGLDGREFMFGVRSAEGEITLGHFCPGRPTVFMQIAETDAGYVATAIAECDWWEIQ